MAALLQVISRKIMDVKMPTFGQRMDDTTLNMIETNIADAVIEAYRNRELSH